MVRHLGRFPKADELAALIAYLEAPLPSTSFVLVWERAPASMSESGARSTARLPAVPAALDPCGHGSRG